MSKLTIAQQLWVDALRSGEYQQTKKTLQDDKGYCCLGVACHVAAKNGIPVVFDELTGTLLGGSLFGYSEVKNWLGLDYKNNDGYVMSNGLSLALLNDFQNYSFPMLADYIEHYADELFVQEGE